MTLEEFVAVLRSMLKNPYSVVAGDDTIYLYTPSGELLSLKVEVTRKD